MHVQDCCWGGLSNKYSIHAAAVQGLLELRHLDGNKRVQLTAVLATTGTNQCSGLRVTQVSMVVVIVFGLQSRRSEFAAVSPIIVEDSLMWCRSTTVMEVLSYLCIIYLLKTWLTAPPPVIETSFPPAVLQQREHACMLLFTWVSCKLIYIRPLRCRNSSPAHVICY